ncbi:kelch-like protein 10 isoform X2 [Ictalurus punctatus]|uniref:Kelch-like protein 10 isoform X2 n=1 Tax=Ictalurus punctatus TaxID=7998 RepID=A0A2D0PM60_ICTPU|nr:kelch-like protein 10 isoform X2 [Ictalurus punctatus]
MSKQEVEKGMEKKVDAMSCNINELRLEKQLCDGVIMVDDGEFHVHKIILCGCSPYFRVLFTNGCHPPDKLSLVSDCCRFLKAQLCPENCVNIWRFAHSHFCEKLKQQAFRFILHNFEEMVRLSKEFLELTVEQLSEIIEKDKLNVKQESVVFEAVLQWIKHEPWKRKAHIGVLLPKVRLGLLTHDYLMNNVSNNIFVMDDVTRRPIVTSVLTGIDDLNPSLSLSSDLTRLRLPSAVLLAIGGFSNKKTTNAIEAYDTRAARWNNVTNIDESPRGRTRTVYLNGFVYCIGGFGWKNFLSSMRRFDPITRTWAEVSRLQSSRCDMGVCVLDGHIYVMGGFDGDDHLNTVERYEPENGRWSKIAPMHEQKRDCSATVLNGKMYVCGGFDGRWHLDTGECYSPQTGVWTLIAPMIIGRSRLGVVAYGGQVYAVGGYDGVNHLSDVEVYNPQTDMWTQGPAMNNKRSNFGIEVLDDLLFVAGGENGTASMGEVECYDEQTSEWHAVTNMEFSRSDLSCCVLSGLPNMAEYAAP